MTNDGAVAQLVSMGFDPDSVREALQACGGNTERAVEVLLGGGGSSGGGAVGGGGGSGGGWSGAPSDIGGVPTPSSVVRCPTSQYTVPGGRSACTCVALSAAESFLRAAAAAAAESEGGAAELAQSILTPKFLSDAITGGVEAYNALRTSPFVAGASGVEHMSAEEVLAFRGSAGTSTPVIGTLASLEMAGPVRQGVLSSGSDAPLGLRAVLGGILGEESLDQTKWTAVLITKTPETVVCALPPQAPPGVAGGDAEGTGGGAEGAGGGAEGAGGGAEGAGGGAEGAGGGAEGASGGAESASDGAGGGADGGADGDVGGADGDGGGADGDGGGADGDGGGADDTGGGAGDGAGGGADSAGDGTGGGTDGQQRWGGYVLIDSHPRQHLGFGEGSYAALHDDLPGLVRTLEGVFPVTDLGSDVGEMMAAMYNSFDAYVLQRKS